MKKLICISALVIEMMACQKEKLEIPSVVITTVPSVSSQTSATFQNQTLVLEGTFMNGVHATSGTVKVYEDKSKNRSLVLENFKTDTGPDLRLYIAEDKVLTNFIQITDKVNTNGSYVLPIPSEVDLKKQNTVVVWCRAFSVLFGSASLK